MDKNGVLKNFPADLQHFDQRRLALQGPLERLGPEVVFVKNLLDFVVDLQRITVLGHGEQGGGKGKIVQVRPAEHNKMDVLIAAEIPVHILRQNQIDVWFLGPLVPAVKPDAHQGRGFIAIVKYMVLLAGFQFIGQHLHIQQIPL